MRIAALFPLLSPLAFSCVLAALPACKSKGGGGSGGAATPAPGDAVKMSPLPPTADGTLSMLEAARGSCVWVRIDPPNTRTEIAKFDGTCAGGSVSWSVDGGKAVVVFDRGEESHIFEVTLATRQFVQLPLVDWPVRDVGYDASGKLVALAAQTVSEEDAVRGFSMVDGQKIPLGDNPDGEHIIAHAYRLDGDAWKRFESKSSIEGEIYQGVSALDASKTLPWKQSSSAMLQAAGSPNSAGEPIKDTKKLDATCAPDRDKEADDFWIAMKDAPSVHVLEEQVDFTVIFDACLQVGERLVDLPDLFGTDEHSLIPLVRGDLLLVHTNSHPRLYEIATGKLVWKSDAALETVFWPK